MNVINQNKLQMKAWEKLTMRQEVLAKRRELAAEVREQTRIIAG